MSSDSPDQPVPDEVAAIQRATKDPLIGTNILGYEVKARIGSGGMGIVYEAEQTTIGKRVAIKVLRPDVADKPGQVEALVAEARAVNRVGHRGIVDVFGFGVLPDGRQALAMELLEGEALQEILEKNRAENQVMPVGEVMLILEEVLSALDAAHSAGVIHRDLKPSNIFLCRQRGGGRYVKLLDFGIAKLVDTDGQVKSNQSLIMGTPTYMAPEQAFRGKVTPALDLYALGVIAFELLTNKLPFNSPNMVELLYKHAEEPPPKPSDILMSIPDEIDDLVLSLLQKKPEDRPQDANAVRLVVKRARKLLLHSTAHPELRLSRDKATGKLTLEERPKDELDALLKGAPMPRRKNSGEIPATGAAPKRKSVAEMPAVGAPRKTSGEMPAAAPRKSDPGGIPAVASDAAIPAAPMPRRQSQSQMAAVGLSRARSVGPAPAPRSAPRKFEDDGERTIPEDLKKTAKNTPVPPAKPDDATFVPGRPPPGIDALRAELAAGAVPQTGTISVTPSPYRLVLIIGVAAVVALGGLLIWKIRGDAGDPKVTEIVEIKPGVDPALEARVTKLEQRIAEAQKAGKKVAMAEAQVRALRASLGQRDAKDLEAEVRLLEGADDY